MRHGRAGHPRIETLKQKERIRELAREGRSDEDIAKIIGRSVQTVRKTTRFMPKPGDEE